MRCFAVPVPEAPTPTAISVSGPAARVTIDSADHIVPLLKRVAKELTAQFVDNHRCLIGPRVKHVNAQRRPAQGTAALRPAW